ncbi:MAG: hypothetical protein ABIP75_00085 [Pyrinomonadaceae bacterium]
MSMYSFKKFAGSIGLAFVVAAVSLSGAPVSAAPPDQPLMQEARAELQQAHAALNRALENKGGHRVKAMNLVQSAIREVTLGIQFDRRHAHGVRFAAADQPNMQTALDHLRIAKNKLENATEDKGGHRKNALRYVNDAIDEVNKGIAAGN